MIGGRRGSLAFATDDVEHVRIPFVGGDRSEWEVEFFEELVGETGETEATRTDAVADDEGDEGVFRASWAGGKEGLQSHLVVERAGVAEAEEAEAEHKLVMKSTKW